MVTKYVDIDENKWGVIVIYDFDMLDWDDLMAIMQSFGMTKDKAKHAIQVLSMYNTGLCISNDGLRMSAVFISDTTSYSQFLNSISHELHHVVSAIIEYYDEPCDGESSAYLHGYLMQRVIEEITEPSRYKNAF